jgi:hypothetical protein
MQPESCEWDKNKNVFYFSDQINSKINIYSSTGVKANMEFSDASLSSPAGMVVWDDILYVASFDNGMIIKFNTTSGNMIGSYNLGSHNVNGLCLDTENMLLYVTDIGLDVMTFQMNDNQGMWAVKLSDGTIWEVFNNTMNYFPNGCVYNTDDKMIYVCQTNLGGVGNNKLFMINYMNSMFTIMDATGTLAGWDMSSDGIIFTNDGDLYVTTWGTFGIGTGYINIYEDNEWTTAISNLSGPADIGYDDTNNRICIPNYLSSTGMITEIQEDDTTTTTTAKPNSSTRNMIGLMIGIIIFLFHLISK